MNNAFDPARIDELDPSIRDLTGRRTRLLGPAYRLFYDTPIEVVAGRGALLYDKDGNEYLDAYNNVVCLGHAHPRVADAVHKQMRTLCTHTRYLHEGILDYAADLLPTFGGRIGAYGHAMFTCTGSEANDLAVRIAKHHTGRRGIIVTAEAYHGTSELTASFSPALGRHCPLGTWVRRVPAPDSYRLRPTSLGRWLAEKVTDQIRDLERRGDGLAAFVVDPVFSSDGIYTQPTDVLRPVIDVVHQAGGLFVADEVQSGFGRTGGTLWGYQRHGIDPDIVTMGKPMGNGYPVAGLVMDGAVVESFGHSIRYFNTFGGNTVAIAAAQATFDVLREEGLRQNAEDVGAFLKAGLETLAAHYDVIGDIRGSGLYLGVEFVTGRDTKDPDRAATAAVVNELRDRRILVSSTGCHSNVLKIRPPLVFSHAHASRLLTELEAVLTHW
jgi:4-aminobutyrate aminotransferase-like enzyme